MYEEQPLDRFRQRALHRAGRMQFDPFLVNEAIATLTCSLGMEWVVGEADTLQRGTPWPFRNHPVGQIIHAAGESQVAAALELAHYLKAAADSRAFPTLVTRIKARDNTQYGHTLLQLAFHNRLALLADKPPLLEPPADGGRTADIELHHLDRLYLVECYARSRQPSASDQEHWLTKKTIDAIANLDGVFSIAIQLHSLLEANERKQLHRRIVATAKRLAPVYWRIGMRPPSELVESNGARVSVSRTRPSRLGEPAPFVVHPAFPQLGDPDRFTAAEEVPEADIRGLNPTASQGTYLHQVAVWLPADQAGLPENVDDQILNLVRKMRNKLVQTRSSNARRMLIVDAWTAHARFGFSREAQVKVKRAIFGTHSNVAGVLLVTRHYDNDVQRHRYHMKPLVNDMLGDPLIDDLVALETALAVPAVLS